MTSEHGPTHFLSAEEMRVLKFAVRRQLTRWASRRHPNAAQQARRATLQRVLHVLENDAFAEGCGLYGSSE
jgi:hypothetical protein